MADRNQNVVPEARTALEQLKMETAAELGIPNYDHADKGMFPSRVNGTVGGYMVKKLIALAEQQLDHKK